MWIVMTSSAQMPSSVKAKYRNVALVHVSHVDFNMGYRPAMISPRARGVLRLTGMRTPVIHLGHYHVGKTERCAYAIALRDAQARADRLNSMGVEVQNHEIITWGGSA